MTTHRHSASARVHIRLSEAERDAILDLATRARMTVSAYLRAVALGGMKDFDPSTHNGAPAAARRNLRQ